MEIGTGRLRRKPHRREQRRHGRRLAGAEFDDKNAVGREQRRHTGGNRAIAVKAIGTAVERKARIEIAHFRGERVDVAGSHIRRIGNDQVEWPAKRRGHVAGDERDGRHAEPPRVRARHGKCALTRVGANSECARQFAHERKKQCAAARAEIGYAAHVRTGALCVDGGERRLDDCFGVRSRHQRRLRERKLQTPKFLVAHDARDRLARQAPARERFDRVALSPCERTRAGSRERRLAEAERMTDKNARVEFG